MSCSDNSDDVYRPTYVYLYRCRLCRETFEKKTIHAGDPSHVLHDRSGDAFANHRRPATRRTCSGVGDLVGGYYEKQGE